MILITGHKGFIGTYLQDRLDTMYTGMGNFPPSYIGIDIKDGNDILNCELPPADIVIHLAAEPGVVASMLDPAKNAETNILGTIRLLKSYPNAKFIFASSGGTIQETIESPYGLSKYTCEEYIKILHDNYVILRFPNVYGKGSRSVIDKFIQGDINIFGDGSATRTYGYVDDIVAAIIQSMTWDKGTYKLGSNQNYSVLDIAAEIAPKQNKNITFLGKRKGELDHSKLINETPSWNTTKDVMEYIKENVG